MAFFQKDASLESLGDRLIATVRQHYPTLAGNQLALTWLVYDPPYPVNTGGALNAADFWQQPIRGYSYRGMERVYPASVVKLFYLVAAHEWLDKGMISPSDELERALRDAIIDSSNDATSLIMDYLSGTTSGPELPPGPFATWKHQRQIVNRYLQGFGWPEFESINVCQKTWCDGPYGRERAFVGEDYSNRNGLTTDAIARLLHAIVGGVAVSAERSRAMMTLLRRSLDPGAIAALDPDYNQISGFLGEALPPQASIWSKAGWTSKVRLDCAYVELGDPYPPYLLSVAINHPEVCRDQTVLPLISKLAIASLADLQPPA
jgi:beta-lactamase class A